MVLASSVKKRRSRSLSYTELFLIKCMIIFTPKNYILKANMDLEKKHSTELSAIEMIDKITQELNKGNTPLDIFLDLSKAFDTLDHEFKLYK